MTRSNFQKFKDFITFPVRALWLFEEDKLGLSALSSERYDFVAREVVGYCLDVGCGKHNRFINEYLKGEGKGIDVFLFLGLSRENIPKDITHFPFVNSTFDSVTFIASINHIPESKRMLELKEAYRCLKPGGKIIVTMGNPLAEIVIHKIIFLYAKIFKNHSDMDSDRGISEGEKYYLTGSEIKKILSSANFKCFSKKRFWTQWGLNHMIIGWKK